MSIGNDWYLTAGALHLVGMKRRADHHGLEELPVGSYGAGDHSTRRLELVGDVSGLVLIGLGLRLAVSRRSD